MTLLRINDKSCMKGVVKVFVTTPSGTMLWYHDPNIVVNLGKERIAKFLAGETIDKPDVMVIGNGGSSPPNNISPTAPDPTDTSLAGRIGATPLQSGQTTTDAAATQPVVISRALSSVRYDSTFNSNDIQNSSYPLFGPPDNLGLSAVFVSELGLLTTAAADEIMARVTFAPISFVSGSSTSISIQWIISVV